MPELSSGLQQQYNQELHSLKPSKIRSFNDKISDIPNLIKLTIGEPDLNTPEHVKEAAIRSIKNNETHYSSQPGMPRLRKAIHHYLKQRLDLEYNPSNEIVVTIGATEAIFASMMSILNPGDEIVIPTPTFPLYRPIVELTGAKPILVNTTDNGFVLSPNQLERIIEQEKGKVKAVLLNYPGNPTGVEYSKDDLESLAKVIKKHQIYVLADEIYNELIYGVKHYSIANILPEQTILLNGVSKSHAMTGWRIGYVAAPAQIIKEIRKAHAFLVTAPSNPAQAAAAEALQNGLDDPLRMRKIYQKRRDDITEQLNQMGLKTILPKGAFYVFSKIPEGLHQTSDQFAMNLAKKAKVGVIPGDAFGPGGEGFIRISYAASEKSIHTAMQRIQNYLASVKEA